MGVDGTTVTIQDNGGDSKDNRRLPINGLARKRINWQRIANRERNTPLFRRQCRNRYRELRCGIDGLFQIDEDELCPAHAKLEGNGATDPIGGGGTGARDSKTFAGPLPPADAGRLRDGDFGKAADALFTNMGSGDPGSHPIPSRDMWGFNAHTPGEEYNMPFGRSDGDFDDAVTDQL